MKGMKYFTILIMLITSLLSPLSPVHAQSSSEEKSMDILIIVDQLALESQYSNNLSALETLLSSLGKTMKVVRMVDYEQGGFLGYSKLIILKNNEDPVTNPYLQSEIKTFSGEILYLGFPSPELLPELDTLKVKKQMATTIALSFNNLTLASILVDEIRVIERPPSDGEAVVEVNGERYPFSQRVGNVIDVPFFIGNEAFQICLGGLLKTWLNDGEPSSMVLLIPQIYPFSDLSMVIEMTKRFYENGIPFTLGVVLVSENSDYPAMEHFYQVLRYVQSKNGTILIHMPDPETMGDNPEALNEKISSVVTTMVDKGVYPLGIVTPENWFLENSFEPNTIKDFSSGIIVQSQGTTATAITNATTFKDGSLGISLETIENTRSQQRNFGNYPIDTAIVLALPGDEDALTSVLEKLNGKWLSLTDYKKLDHQWVVGENTLSSGPMGVVINGTGISLSFDEGKISDDFIYRPKPIYSLENIFNAGNAFLLMVVGIIVILFLVIVGFSRRVYLRKFRNRIRKNSKKDFEEKSKDKDGEMK